MRHNLSLRPCFRKCPRWTSDGKKLSAYWELDTKLLPTAAKAAVEYLQTLPSIDFPAYMLETGSDDEDDASDEPGRLPAGGSRSSSKRSSVDRSRSLAAGTRADHAGDDGDDGDSDTEDGLGAASSASGADFRSRRVDVGGAIRSSRSNYPPRACPMTPSESAPGINRLAAKEAEAASDSPVSAASSHNTFAAFRLPATMPGGMAFQQPSFAGMGVSGALPTPFFFPSSLPPQQPTASALALAQQQQMVPGAPMFFAPTQAPPAPAPQASGTDHSLGILAMVAEQYRSLA